ncbi:hypothetical protein SGFS_071010 [Streptomyces graminofaciens]|uniref:Uncharacterized protein n=1 Tax=Streptomyces graminofaciens TaxID=68212 RepID=A0ABM7FFE8_9ACTN|nr:hypothetical protein [Streptomyces graminofaciens]BBC35807.1 hypothetical protein SGFS_071010 [Streptomyces graminofaciens]
MTDHQGQATAYEQLYSAAARMLWSQENPDWRPGYEDEQYGWPRERRVAWQALESCLRAADGEGASAGEAGGGDSWTGEAGGRDSWTGEPSDSARHLLARRAPGDDDRPLSFRAALADWTTRLDADPGYLTAGDTLRPGACVLLPASRHWVMVFALQELAYRLAPGRPPVTVGADAARLSTLAHEAAQALRAPLGAPAPSPYEPGAAPWVSPVSRRVGEGPDARASFEELRETAWRAAEAIPSPEELKANPDFSVTLEASIAASDVLALLSGRPARVWREQRDGIDPARHLLWGSSAAAGAQGQPKGFVEEADSWAEAFAGGPAPWTPTEYVLPPERDRGETDVVLSATRALVLAELLDELAARLRPGVHSGLIHYGAYDLGHFVNHRFRRELGAHVGL